MAWLAIVGSTALSMAAANRQAKGAEMSGEAALRVGQERSVEAEFEAGQTVASSQRAGLEQARQADLVASRAKALAAAGGGSASDPTIVNLVSKIHGEGALRSMTALYEGEERARKLRQTGQLAEEMGIDQSRAYSVQASADRLKGFAALAGGAGSMYAKYGGSGGGAGIAE